MYIKVNGNVTEIRIFELLQLMEINTTVQQGNGLQSKHQKKFNQILFNQILFNPDGKLPDEMQSTPTTPSGQKCPPITDSAITKQFEDESSLLKYPNDRNYRYKKIGGDWFAKNIINKKVFNITKCGYTTSVEKLNKEFPTGS